MAEPTHLWIFGDQLGAGSEPTVTESLDKPVVVIESMATFRRHRYHRAKAHLVLSAIRHRVAEMEAAGMTVVHVRADTYAEGFALAGIDPATVEVHDPTSHRARAFVRRLGAHVLPSVGFTTTEDDFATWMSRKSRKRLLMEDFYRDARVRLDVLMEGGDPVGGAWNYDHDNRQPPPAGAGRLGVPPAWEPVEDDIDASVRCDLDASGITFAGRDDTRRFAASRQEALSALEVFVRDRLPTFGPYEDAVLVGDWTMSHSLLSAPLNLGLLDPMECVRAAEAAYRRGDAPLASVEGFARQLIGWRDWVWHLYWSFGPDYLTTTNALSAHTPLPDWFADLDADAVDARCLRTALADVRDHGWTHHIPRLMVLGNWALQRGYDPVAMTEWFRCNFVDGYEWVMAVNVLGMSLYADGGRTVTKPYAAGGAYINRMSDACGGCTYRPTVRLGERACPFTAGYWAFIDGNREHLRGNHRMAQVLAGASRLSDLEAVVEQEKLRGAGPP